MFLSSSLCLKSLLVLLYAGLTSASSSTPAPTTSTTATTSTTKPPTSSTAAAASNGFPCAMPAANGGLALSLNDASTFHHTFPIEWYFVTGSLCAVDPTSAFADGECANPMGFQLTTWLGNVTLLGKNIIAATSNVAVSSPTHYAVGGGGLPTFDRSNGFNLAFASTTGVSINYNVIYGKPGVPGAVFHFYATTPNATIDLVLREMSPIMYQGNGGYVGNPTAATCTASYYLSFPQLWTIGTITLNGVPHMVKGTSWFDHQWGSLGTATSSSSSAGAAGGGWIWSGLHIGTDSMMLYVPHSHWVNVYTTSIAGLQHHDGTMELGTVSNIVILQNWTSPVSGTKFPISIKVQTSFKQYPELTLSPFFTNQELALGADYYEGDVEVTVTCDDKDSDDDDDRDDDHRNGKGNGNHGGESWNWGSGGSNNGGSSKGNSGGGNDNNNNNGWGWGNGNGNSGNSGKGKDNDNGWNGWSGKSHARRMGKLGRMHAAAHGRRHDTNPNNDWNTGNSDSDWNRRDNDDHNHGGDDGFDDSSIFRRRVIHGTGYLELVGFKGAPQ